MALAGKRWLSMWSGGAAWEALGLRPAVLAAIIFWEAKWPAEGGKVYLVNNHYSP